MFDRLWRKDKARKSGDAHAGLGLSLARSCAQSLGLHLTASLDETQKMLTFSLKKGETDG
jgi:signal transduction histidine kinase